SSADHPEAGKLVKQLSQGFQETAESIVPWFLEQMPRMYFQDTDPATQLSHLQAIIAARTSDRPLAMTLKSEDGSEWTALRVKDEPGVLADIVASLPMDLSLRSAKIHTAFDGNLVLDSFEFGEPQPFDQEDPEQAQKLEAIIEYAQVHSPDWPAESIREHIANCTSNYVDTLTPLRICHHRDLFEQVSGTDGTIVELEQEADPTESRITVVLANTRTRTSLERCASLLARHRVDIKRAYLDVVRDPKFGSVTFVGFVVQSPEGGQLDPESEFWNRIRTDLTRVKWVHHDVIKMTGRNPGLRIGPGEIILGLCHLVHQVLNPKNRFEFTRDRIRASAEANLELSSEIAELFRARFNPEHALPDSKFDSRAEALEAAIQRTASSETARAVLHSMLEAVRHVLRTNYYVHGRFGLCLRLDPAFLTNEDRVELPYGVFFVHGRDFNGFHVRFQDIARGGLRVVRPRSESQKVRESERLYDEVYGLAFAQQLKNKDIPEGGAKAAILVEPGARPDRCIKAFVDSLLDLITPAEHTRQRVVSRTENDELIYLGPDENITPNHIDWIVRRAALRGYSLPTAFMSSKPGAGINHKTYGVTSEGVNVFLDLALQSVGIDPHSQPFTVKITGGPDGDVAGNMIRILDRDYGSNARIVGLADGSGSAEDPDGFDIKELLRLFEHELPIASFDPAKLGPKGKVHSVEESDGPRLRDTMHNRVVADAFVPAGGRPDTIHSGNWRDYLGDDGVPSSKVIVEGANLFLTPEARELLSSNGVVIVQDSSANKCGVICSSFEICACMLLEEDEFLAMKPVFVEQVLDRLRSLARLEAMLLISEHARHPEVSLPQLSLRLSRIINGTAPLIADAISGWSPEDQALARQLVLDHLPPILLEKAE
ncbi:MAG: NAD-glutamate dehydrogenase, partial [Phycisphaerales bacterium]|nr:NAD-glutamate dehydrogenase [Phycisphaerales bacterium]